jgi:hypothetical protein
VDVHSHMYSRDSSFSGGWGNACMGLWLVSVGCLDLHDASQVPSKRWVKRQANAHLPLHH